MILGDRGLDAKVGKKSEQIGTIRKYRPTLHKSDLNEERLTDFVTVDDNQQARR